MRSSACCKILVVLFDSYSEADHDSRAHDPTNHTAANNVNKLHGRCLLATCFHAQERGDNRHISNHRISPISVVFLNNSIFHDLFQDWSLSVSYGSGSLILILDPMEPFASEEHEASEKNGDSSPLQTCQPFDLGCHLHEATAPDTMSIFMCLQKACVCVWYARRE